MNIQFLGSGAETVKMLLEKDFLAKHAAHGRTPGEVPEADWSEGFFGDPDIMHVLTVSASGVDRASKINSQITELLSEEIVRNADKIICSFCFSDNANVTGNGFGPEIAAVYENPMFINALNRPEPIKLAGIFAYGVCQEEEMSVTFCLIKH